MPKLVVTPWKWHEELLEVRAWFYPNHSHEGPDLRRQACALVRTLQYFRFPPFLLTLGIPRLLSGSVEAACLMLSSPQL